jgi:pantoate--beta-alanine ligase
MQCFYGLASLALALHTLAAYSDLPLANSLKTVRSISTATRWSQAAPKPLVLVPTMGALHAGHTRLIDRARQLAGAKGRVVVSIFVNPTQFGPTEDFSRYPRPLAADLSLCARHGADLVFHPSAASMYPPDFSTYVDESTISERLCGASRPGHFRGVCTVVSKLFQIIQPQVAVFGLKDFQQCAIIRRMVRDLNLPVRIVPVETVREADGLALSSRNRYLSPEEREQAPILRGALRKAREAWRQGETSPAKIRRQIIRTITTAPLARIDYVEIADASTLQPIPRMRPNTVIALAVFFGSTRLIDNIWLR